MFSFLKQKIAGSPSSTEPATPIAKELLEMQGIPEDKGVKLKSRPLKDKLRISRHNSPLDIDPKAMAKAAAARIDAIEQEIALDLRGAAAANIGMHPKARQVAMRTGFSRVAPPSGSMPTPDSDVNHAVAAGKPLTASSNSQLDMADGADGLSHALPKNHWSKETAHTVTVSFQATNTANTANTSNGAGHDENSDLVISELSEDSAAFAPAADNAAGKRKRTEFSFTAMPEGANTLMLGETNLRELIEVKQIHMAPKLEESAVLFANGQLDAAIEALEIGFAGDSAAAFGNSEFNAYRVMFDLLRIKGDADAFERYALEFAMKFEKSAPPWLVEKTFSETKIFAIPTLDLGEILDSSIVPVLEQLKVVAQQSKRMRLDAGNITNINPTDGFGCELLLRVLTAFENTAYELELVGVHNLFVRLRPYIQSKTNNVSGHLWLLYLELLRMQDQQLLFEDVSIKFAMLYEVSPPSWREPSKQLQTDTRPNTPEGYTVPNSDISVLTGDPTDVVHLAGEITSDSNALINQLAQSLYSHPTVVCDCADLRMVSFEAAGRLLTALTAWSSELKTVEFKNLSHPIATLFVVLGIQHLAVVERRRDA
jgi:ABC-type transporter Mla MlaB component